MDDQQKKQVTVELNLRKKAISDPNFPNEETISQFVNTHQKLASFDAAWKKPDICRFARFCTHMLEWELEYGFEKIFPMLTRWILLHSEHFTDEELVPDEIVKKRVVKGVPSFDLAWRPNGENLPVFLSLMSDECACLSEGKCMSVEPQVLVADRLPELHAMFLVKTSKKKAPKEKNSKKATKKCEDEATAVIDALSLEPSKKIKPKSSKWGKSRVGQNIAGPVDIPMAETSFTSNTVTQISPQNGTPLRPAVCSSPHPVQLLERDSSFGLFDYSAIHFDTSLKILPRAVSDSSFFSGKCEEIINEEQNTEASIKTQQLSFKNLTLNESIVLSDDSTIDYEYGDISAIVDDIVSRKRFY